MSTEITVQIIRRRHISSYSTMLLVTSDGRWLECEWNDKTGAVSNFGGSIWPADIPAVFKTAPDTAQRPCRVRARASILRAFIVTAASLRVPVNDQRAADELAHAKDRDILGQQKQVGHWAMRALAAIDMHADKVY